MVSASKTYLISDMGVAHLMTLNEKWIEIAFARSSFENGKLLEFPTLRDANEFCKARKLKGSAVQPISSADVEWEQPPLEEGNDLIDWEHIQEIVQGVLEKATDGSEKSFRKKAKELGVSYEQFLVHPGFQWVC